MSSLRKANCVVSLLFRAQRTKDTVLLTRPELSIPRQLLRRGVYLLRVRPTRVLQPEAERDGRIQTAQAAHRPVEILERLAGPLNSVHDPRPFANHLFGTHLTATPRLRLWRFLTRREGIE